MSRRMRVALVIPARAGSKGIPRKNMQEVGGRPLVVRALMAAAATTADGVYVYSDSEEILAAARAAARELALGNVEAVDRPADVSADDTTSEVTMIRFIADHLKPDVDAVGMVQCTTPFLRAKHVERAIELMLTGRYQAVVTATPFARFLGYGGGAGEQFIPLAPYRWRRQEVEAAPPFWLENGGVYMARREVWIAGRRHARGEAVVPMGWWESLEIDDPLDLAVARALEPLLAARQEEP